MSAGARRFGGVLGARSPGVGAAAMAADVEELAGVGGASYVIEVVADHLLAAEQDGAASLVSGPVVGWVDGGAQGRNAWEAEQGRGGGGWFSRVGFRG